MEFKLGDKVYDRSIKKTGKVVDIQQEAVDVYPVTVFFEDALPECSLRCYTKAGSYYPEGDNVLVHTSTPHDVMRDTEPATEPSCLAELREKTNGWQWRMKADPAFAEAAHRLAEKLAHALLTGEGCDADRTGCEVYRRQKQSKQIWFAACAILQMSIQLTAYDGYLFVANTDMPKGRRYKCK